MNRYLGTYLYLVALTRYMQFLRSSLHEATFDHTYLRTVSTSPVNIDPSPRGPLIKHLQCNPARHRYRFGKIAEIVRHIHVRSPPSEIRRSQGREWQRDDVCDRAKHIDGVVYYLNRKASKPIHVVRYYHTTGLLCWHCARGLWSSCLR